MTDISSSEILKPLNWQDFQRSCVALFRQVIRDPLLQEWGREGQEQHGIDLFGFRDRDPSRPVGVQAKRIDDPITEKKLRVEIAKARKLRPALTELIFATTSDRDAKIQAVAAQLTQELDAEGWPCQIVVMGWQDLRAEIVKYPEALDAFRPTGAVFDQPLLQEMRQSKETLELILEKVEELSSGQTILKEVYDVELEPEARTELASLHTEITGYRNLIRKGQSAIPLEELSRLLGQDLPPYARYRVLSNICAIYLNSGCYEEALDYSRRAFELRPTDVKSRTNLAYAELAAGKLEEAARRAKAILADHPSHAPAANVVLQARASDPAVTDPAALVPAETHETVEFAIGAVVFRRRHGDPTWREHAIAAAKSYPDNEALIRFAAEAELEPVLNNPEAMLGKQMDAEAITTVKRCAGVLRKLWEKEVASESRNPEELVPLASNLAMALRHAQDDSGAADVLDRALALVGKNAALLRARALLHLHADQDEKAVELLINGPDDPEARLFAAQVLAAKQPARALERIDGLDPNGLPEHLRPIIPEVKAEIALTRRDGPSLLNALKELEAIEGTFATRALLQARGQAAGLIGEGAPESGGTGLLTEEEREDAPVALPLHVQKLIKNVRAHEAELDFSDRLQLAQYLDNQRACEAASDLLCDHVQPDRDTVGLRTYLQSTIGAKLAARAQSLLSKIPSGVLEMPFYRRMAAVHYWNSGDAMAAAPLIEATYLAKPDKLGLLLWYLDSLLRIGKQDEVREFLKQPVEDAASGSVAERSRLARALANFGQHERALKVAYRGFALNRNDPDAWMGLISVTLGRDEAQGLNLLSEVISADHSFEVRLADGTLRRYLIESDESVRKVEHDAVPPDHVIAKAAAGLRPGDTLAWPGDGRTATITSAKHKYLDALHFTLARYNERFPDSQGLRRISFETEGENAFEGLKVELKARSDYVRAQGKLYAEGKMSLGMLALMTGADTIDVVLGLKDADIPYRVAIGLAQERETALAAIKSNNGAGCVVDAPTYHYIRRLGLEKCIVAVCGKIGVSQHTIDIFKARLASILLDKSGAGSMGVRDGKLILTERTEQEKERTRATIQSDLDWLLANADILPARPIADPPAAFRSLGSAKDARLFDDIYAASGSNRLLLVDDLFTRQAAGIISVPGASLQPVLMLAASRKILPIEDYVKAVTELADIGQHFIAIDGSLLSIARKLDIEAGDTGVGRRFKAAARALGGRHADPASHTSVVVTFLDALWADHINDEGRDAATSLLIRELLKGRTEDYRTILDSLDRRMAHRPNLRLFLREWARGHFLSWP